MSPSRATATTACTAAEHESTSAPHSPPESRQARQLRLPLDAYTSAEVQRAAYGPSGEGGCLKAARHQLVRNTAPPDDHALNQLTGTALETSRQAPEARGGRTRHRPRRRGVPESAKPVTVWAVAETPS
ncbi:hypothetical protein RM550_36705 [Streptomyces sp. DSM 41527]|uniref:DUF397 domain-containing protein n=1 Tax=Streptomyces mooreae TaxID=3075523 RepID=A0ABU2TJT7_9ACTN|nr:hypothetical protein [Streptomyces sp. DSM 41527]MDT0461183.1 hypothetical protein [Streptomyces sp. DSM 41527]